MANYAKAKSEAERLIAENYIFQPPINPYELAANEGLTVTEFEFSDELTQFAGFINLQTREVIVNLADSLKRRKFTVAHELGHWILHQELLQKNPDLGVLPREPIGRAETNPYEKEANSFAANLLVPDDLLKDVGSKDIHLLARIFAVSEEMMGYRLKGMR